MPDDAPRDLTDRPTATVPRFGRHGTAGAAIASALDFDHVTRDFGGIGALNGVTLGLAPGETVCLLGPSGCGKSTLLRIAAGIDRPSSGAVRVDGREVAGPKRFVPPEARNVGLMFQDFALFPHLSVRRNVMFGLKALGRSEADRTAMAALERVGLTALADAYPDMLSGGEQQRVALARAIAPRPSILLMDEPFSGLDVQLRDYMREETLAILRETRSTAMIVTHDPQEALQLGDRIAVLRAGRVVQVGEANELYRRPRDLFVARFFSDVNEVRARVDAGAIDIGLVKLKAKGLRDGEAVTVCLRQRALQLEPAGTGWPGRVVGARFLGDTALVDLAVAGLDVRLKARLPEAAMPEKGADIGLSVRPNGILVFPDPIEPG